jgi:hypothetical protein
LAGVRSAFPTAFSPDWHVLPLGRMKALLAGYFFIGAAGGFAFDLLQLNASRVGGGFFWPVLVGTGATALRAAGIKRFRLIPLVFLLVVVTGWLGYWAAHVSPPLPVPVAVHRSVLFDAIGILVGIGFGTRFLLFFAGTEGLASVRMQTEMAVFNIPDTAFGSWSLYTSTGGYNTAVGVHSLEVNTSGTGNTAIGMQALGQFGSGNENTAIGFRAGLNTTDQNNSGSGNTFVGYRTTPGTQATPTNETAIGANAEVDTINAMVLGSIIGVNLATANTNVGIGTTTPSFPLHIGNQGGGTNNNFFRVEGPAQAGTNGLAASFGGYGDFGIDTVGVPEGRFVVKESGEVGIGTAFPDAALTVNGSADKPCGGSWGVFSDRRLKTLGGNFDSGLSQILELLSATTIRATTRWVFGIEPNTLGSLPRKCRE